MSKAKGLLDKIQNFNRAIQQHGGYKGAFLQWFRTDEVKWGTLVGEDKFGNKYYENNYYFVGRNRWVQFADQYGWDYDGSQIPADWHRWVHNMTDQPPSTHPPDSKKWMIDHKENLSGTEKEYVPYSTTRPKVEAWVPPSKQ